MVLYVIRWDVHPDKVEAYLEWTTEAMQRILAVPGVVEFRVYFPAAGASQRVVTLEFADFAGWAAFYAHDDFQKALGELRTLTLNATTELWGPDPHVPAPIRPRQ